MKLVAKSLLVLLLSGTVFAQFPSQIKNVIVIVQENRTPDNLFHFLTPVCPIPVGASGLNACTPSPVTNTCYDISPCGISNQSGAPLPVTLTPVSLGNSVDPDHSHSGFNNMCDPDPVTFKCRNDGAYKTTNPRGQAYAYVGNPVVTNYDGSTGHLLDPYLTFAEQYGWANFMYQTNQGPSYPAHQFIFSGTSALTQSADTQSTFISENYNGGTGAGCLASSTSSSWLLSPSLTTPPPGCHKFDNNSVQECPLTNTTAVPGVFCATHQSMADVLDGKSVSWMYYAPSPGSIWTGPNGIDAVCVPMLDPQGNLFCSGTEWANHVDTAHVGTDILTDITGCKLKNVSWVIPNGGWSDHPNTNPNGNTGPSWVAAVINEIGNNPTCAVGTPDAGQNFWSNTAIVVTWDDWGGWSDNQPANVLSGLPCTSTNCQGDYQYGFRVPLIVVSAYTPAHTINNINHDFGSILRMIEGINGIKEGQLGFADARATNDLHAFFTLTTARTYQTVPAVEPPGFFTGMSAADFVPPDTD